MLMLFLAVIDGPRARGIYAQIREAYNSVLRPGARAIPLFEEWQGVSSYCDNYNCRWALLAALCVILEQTQRRSLPCEPKVVYTTLGVVDGRAS